MAHVSVKRFTSCHAQHDGAQNDEGDVRVVVGEAQRVVWTDGQKDRGVGCDVADAQKRDDHEPDNGNGAKKLPYPCSALLLHGKQAKQNEQRQRDHIAFESGGHHFQAFDRREHRNGGRDHAITIKQACAKNTHYQ